MTAPTDVPPDRSPAGSSATSAEVDGQLAARASAVLDEVDPLGLIDSGAPDGEYDLEAARLLLALTGAGQVTAADVTAVFEEFFWVGAIRPVMADRVADRLTALAG